VTYAQNPEESEHTDVPEVTYERFFVNLGDVAWAVLDPYLTMVAATTDSLRSDVHRALAW
jgi:hypothetical protein